MKRTGAVLPAIGLLISSLHCAPAREPPIEQLIQEFTGELEMRSRTPGELEAAYTAVLQSLLVGMGAREITDRRESQQILERMCLRAGRPGAEAERVALCEAIAARCGPGVAKPARVRMIRQLERIGGAECVELLAERLDDEDPQIRELARRALQGNPTPGAVKALRAALRRAQAPAWRIALINALAARREPSSVETIASLVRTNDGGVAVAASAALGDLGGSRVIDTLRGLWRSKNPPLREAATDALIRVGDRLLESGRCEDAATIFLDLYAAGVERTTRVATLRGLVSAQGNDALPTLTKIISDETDHRLRRIAARLAQELPGEAVTRMLAAELSHAPGDVQVVLLDVLAQRGDKTARLAVLKALVSDDVNVRIAALQALRHLGDGSDAILLAQAAAGTRGEERNAARKSLDRLRGADVDAAILAGTHGQDDPLVRAELVRSLGDRGFTPAVPTLLQTVQDASEAVRVAAFDALGKLADEDTLPVLVGFLVNQTSGKAGQAAQDAVVSTCLRIEDRDRRTEPVLAALRNTRGAVEVPVLRVLGRIQGPHALEAVREALDDPNVVVVDAAVRALAKWNDTNAMDDLLRIARTGSNRTHRVLALRGYVRLVRLPSGRTPEQTFGLLEQAMLLAESDEERKRVLAASADVKHIAALNMARSYLAGAALRNEAAVAMIAVARNLATDDPVEAVAAIEEVLAAPVGDTARKKAEDALESIGPLPPPNGLTEAERRAGWRLLFDGKTTDGWRGFRKDHVPDGWKVIDGCLVRAGPGGDIITDEQFDNFELKLEWRVSAGGNSGIFFRVSEDEDAVWRTGPEMQVLDNSKHADGRNPKTSAGSNYGLHAPVRDVTKPVGSFNRARIRVDGGRVEHWLNGVKIVEYELGSEEWEALVAGSKFRSLPKYGRLKKGHIALQDHGDKVWYRNIKIRPLPGAGRHGLPARNNEPPKERTGQRNARSK